MVSLCSVVAMLFEGVSQWLNDGVHLSVDVGVGQCTRHNLHRTNHIMLTQHGNNRTKNDHLFKVLKKCNSKFDCLVYEKLYIKDIKPSLNTQADSIGAKLFT